MTCYKYALETATPRKKYKCPGCGEKSAVMYVSIATGEPINETVCKCDRAGKCQYHLPPREYFKDHPEQKDNTPVTPAVIAPPKPPAYIPADVLIKSMQGYDCNTFTKYLETFVDKATVNRLIDMYKVGTSCSLWDGACVFWFITTAGQVKAGQVKHFDESGKTSSYYSEKYNRFKKRVIWVQNVIEYKCKRQGIPLPEWLGKYIDSGKYCTSLYGEHLLNMPGNENKPVALVEAPKTAIIAAAFMPEYVWVATGALDYFTEDRIKVLAGRDVYVIPDLGAYDKWTARAKVYSHVTSFTMIDTLERIATTEDRAKGLDLADYLVRGIKTDSTLYSSFINEFIKRPDMSEAEQLQIAKDYKAKGLSTQSMQQAINELLAKHHFSLYPQL